MPRVAERVQRAASIAKPDATAKLYGDPARRYAQSVQNLSREGHVPPKKIAKPAPEEAAGARATLRAVLFDFEGTLVEFAWDLEAGEAALLAGLVDMGFSPDLFARDSYATMWNRALGLTGPAGEDALRAHMGPIYDRYDLDALERWRLRPGARETVLELQGRGLQVAVVSNIGRIALEPAIDRFALGDHLDLVVTRDDIRFMKPDGEGLRSCLDRLGVGADQALFVGDSRTDVLAARDAGLRVAIVGGGESAPEAYVDLPPDAFIDALSEVGGLMESL